MKNMIRLIVLALIPAIAIGGVGGGGVGPRPDSGRFIRDYIKYDGSNHSELYFTKASLEEGIWSTRTFNARPEEISGMPFELKEVLGIAQKTSEWVSIPKSD